MRSGRGEIKVGSKDLIGVTRDDVDSRKLLGRLYEERKAYPVEGLGLAFLEELLVGERRFSFLRFEGGHDGVALLNK